MRRVVFVLAAAVIVALASACSTVPGSAPDQDLPQDEQAAVASYLRDVAAVNRSAVEERRNLRDWISYVPAPLWEESRGWLPGNIDRAGFFRQSFVDFREKVEAIRPVPASAGDAHEALLGSYGATLQLIATYTQLIERQVEARVRRDNFPELPSLELDEASTEVRMKEARDQAGRATEYAEKQLGDLARRADFGT